MGWCGMGWGGWVGVGWDGVGVPFALGEGMRGGWCTCDVALDERMRGGVGWHGGAVRIHPSFI